jgi:hypothetical protein
MNYTKDNELIAQFMEFEISENRICFKYPNKKGWVSIPKTLSWDWIMPVVEKIETNLYDVYHPRRGNKLSDIFITTNYNNHPDFPNGWDSNVMTTNMGNIYESGEVLFSTKLEATHNAVVEFIKWYNKNK